MHMVGMVLVAVAVYELVEQHRLPDLLQALMGVAAVPTTGSGGAVTATLAFPMAIKVSCSSCFREPASKVCMIHAFQMGLQSAAALPLSGLQKQHTGAALIRAWPDRHGCLLLIPDSLLQSLLTLGLPTRGTQHRHAINIIGQLTAPHVN